MVKKVSINQSTLWIGFLEKTIIKAQKTAKNDRK